MLKPINTEATLPVIFLQDPAVDLDQSDVKAYLGNVHKDPACWSTYLKFNAGQEPTKFLVGVIPPTDLSRIEDECGLGLDTFKGTMLRWNCFLYGLRDIENPGGLAVEYTNPDTGTKEFKVPKRERNGIEYVNPAWLSKVFGRHLRNAAIFVGGVAWKWNTLGDDDAKNS